MSIDNVSRRHFLGSSAGLSLGLTLGFSLGSAQAASPKAAGASAATAAATGASTATAFEPNAFLRIGTDNTVTVISKHLEMGQGTYTGLATLAAEELDAAWAQVRVEGAPADARRYNNLLWGPAQGTGGSTAMANSWEQMRQAGASARAMLVSAAARRWSVPAADITVREGVVLHAASKRQATFGELAEAAAAEAVPASVALKDPKDFRLIGKTAPRKDAVDKTNGRAQFTQDLHLPGMLVAVVAHPPRFGGKVKSFDAAKAKAVKGVVDVVAIPSGVAVLARDTWSAKKGRDALVVTWDDSAAFKLSSDTQRQRYRDLAATPGLIARQDGQADAALAQAPKAGAGRVISASLDFPYLAHAAMEPINCVVQRTAAGCTVWNGEQMHTGDQFALAKLFGITPEQVTIHTLYAGGSFGRRASKDADYVREAASIVLASGTQAPVKMVWLREDDMKGGQYRPMFHHRLEATLSPQGEISAWRHRLVGQSIAAGSPFESVMVKNGVDALSVEGASTLPYAIPNLQVELHTPKDIGVPVLWWRSVGSTHTAYATETFLDALATEAKQDPVAWRLKMLEKHPRHAAVLALVADKAAWGKPLAKGKKGERRGRGVALHESFGTVVAQVAEVTVARDGSFHVDRVVTAVDCGVAINPDNVRAQVEGSVGFALSAALHGEITLKDGVVEQSNFGDYAPIRIQEMPKVEVHIVPSANKPSGIGEPAVPPVAPAVANALAAATGRRAWRLPLQTEQFKAGAMHSQDGQVLEALLRWSADGHGAALVTVVRTWGSAPRPPGAWMALRDDGLVQGSVSGGCIEDDLVARMRAGEFAGAPVLQRYGVTQDEAARFGLPCGGTLELLIEPAPEVASLRVLSERLSEGRLMRRTVDVATGAITLDDACRGDALQWDGQRLSTVHGPRWRLLIIGAGQIARYLAPMATALDHAVSVCDPREEYALEWDVAGAPLLPGMPDDVVVAFQPDPHTAIVALTHDPKLDDMALLEALKSPAFYVGALGSRVNNAARRERLREHFDLSDDEVARLHGPAGLHIGSHTPPEIALSILAEITAEKNGVDVTRPRSAADTTDDVGRAVGGAMWRSPGCVVGE